MTFRIPLALAMAALLTLTACTSRSDSVRRARDANGIGAATATDEAADFLVQMVDARRMDYAEGALAMTRATTQELRDYGAQMTRDQTELLNELTALAAGLRVSVPDSISDTKRSALNDLVDQHGTNFDDRFMSMIAIDHERDVTAFTDARNFDRDPAVRAFATRRLPLIQRHLDEIKALRQSN